jgi:tRNA A-37 threonylcarbamoyl transferase component Bud32
MSRILKDVAQAVTFMHQKEEPICHRDLNPSNILVSVLFGTINSNSSTNTYDSC